MFEITHLRQLWLSRGLSAFHATQTAFILLSARLVGADERTYNLLRSTMKAMSENSGYDWPKLYPKKLDGSWCFTLNDRSKTHAKTDKFSTQSQLMSDQTTAESNWIQFPRMSLGERSIAGEMAMGCYWGPIWLPHGYRTTSMLDRIDIFWLKYVEHCWILLNINESSLLFSPNEPSGKLTVCYWTWPFIVDLPIKKGWFTHQKRQFSLVILVYQRVQYLFHPIISTRMKNWSNSLNITLSAPRVWRTSAWEWTVQWDCRTHLGVSINGGTPLNGWLLKENPTIFFWDNQSGNDLG